MLKNRFPIFANYPGLVYLDSASTSQRIDVSIQAEIDFYTKLNANVHRGLYPLSERATAAYENVREKVRDFLNAPDASGIVFTKSATEALNIVAQGFTGKFLKAGDEIVLSLLEHHSNIVPWQLASQKTGAVLKFCPLLPDGNLDYEALASLITPKTKIVSVTGLSNVLGTVIDLKRVVFLAKNVGAKVCVDAAQKVAHFPVDVQALDLDFLVFSSHKIYGPTGAGVLFAKPEILEEMDPWLGGGDMIREVTLKGSTWNDIPWKFEAGTPNIAQIIGMGAAINFINEVGYEEIEKHDTELHTYALKKLGELPFITVLGPKDPAWHRGSISFIVKDVHPHDVASILGDKNICVRAGHHCAMPLMKALGTLSTTRVSFGIYNEKDDIDRLLDGLKQVAEKFKILY